MKRKNNKKLKLFSLIFLILFCLYFQTVAYSAINSTMTIKGNAYARAEADVRITDFRLATTNKATSSYEEFGKSHIVTEVSLTDDTSSITYYIEITNYGSADIGIFDINGLPSEVNYSIKDYKLHDKICDDSGKCNSFIKKTYEITLTTTGTYAGSVQMNFDFRTYHKVTYTDIENKSYPIEVIDGGNLNITFKDDLKMVQVLSNNNELAFYKQVSNGQSITINNIFNDVEVKIKEQVAKLKNGDLNKVGSEVCIGEECFYIISNDGSTVSMLSKYNLYVGNEVISANHFGGEIVPLSNPTGMQSNLALGFYSITGEYDDLPWYGTIEFSNDDMHGESYNDYSGSLVEYYVNNYKNLLEVKGVKINNARLLYFNEFSNFGCELDENYYYVCDNSYDWIYSTSYWLENKSFDGRVYTVERGHAYTSDNVYYFNTRYGVRPVIELDVDDIYVPKVVNVVSGDYDTVGSEICIGKECFYVISSTDDTVTMLAKYNLYVGGEYNTSWTAYGDEATGKQDSTMLGYVLGQSIRNGTTAFSSDTQKGTNYSDYSGSMVEGYVNNYKTILETDYGVDVVEARLITKDELTSEEIGCSATNNTCKGSAYPWIYSTSYWSGSAILADYVWFVSSDGYFGFYDYNDDSDFGVRPVITISKDYFKK